MTATCRICRKPFEVTDPPDFAEMCEASAKRQNDEARERIARERFARIQANPRGQRQPIPEAPVITADDVRTKWLASLCHDRCYDNREKRQLLEDRIVKIVGWLTANPDHANYQRALDRIKGIQLAWTKCVAFEYGERKQMDIPDFTNNLLEHHDRIGLVFKCAREYVKDHCKSENNQE